MGPMEQLESEEDTLGLTSVSRREDSRLSYWTRTLEKTKLSLPCTNKNLAWKDMDVQVTENVHSCVSPPFHYISPRSVP